MNEINIIFIQGYRNKKVVASKTWMTSFYIISIELFRKKGKNVFNKFKY